MHARVVLGVAAVSTAAIATLTGVAYADSPATVKCAEATSVATAAANTARKADDAVNTDKKALDKAKATRAADGKTLKTAQDTLGKAQSADNTTDATPDATPDSEDQALDTAKKDVATAQGTVTTDDGNVTAAQNQLGADQSVADTARDKLSDAVSEENKACGTHVPVPPRAHPSAPKSAAPAAPGAPAAAQAAGGTAPAVVHIAPAGTGTVSTTPVGSVATGWA